MASRQQRHWQCIQGCGACCRLDPSLRPEAIAALSPEQQTRYLAMVGADGWCIHYDTGGCRCRIYEDRPDFCHVSALVHLFGDLMAAPDASSAAGSTAQPEPGVLAIACCQEQIRSEYGGRDKVMRRFQRAIRRRP